MNNATLNAARLAHREAAAALDAATNETDRITAEHNFDITRAAFKAAKDAEWAATIAKTAKEPK